MGAVSSTRSILHYSVCFKTTEENFINFWENVKRRFSLEDVVVVMDNHRAHTKYACEKLEEYGAIV